MGNIMEVQVVSSGFPGGPGYTNLYFDAEGVATPTEQFAAANTFATDLIGVFPASWTNSVQALARVLDAATGALIGFENAPAESTGPHVGLNAGGYGSGASGACIAWTTNGVNRTRRVRGRTFLVPIAAPMWEGDGTLTSTALTNIQATADHLIDALVGFGVWSRPVEKAGGAWFPAVAGRCNDRAAVLRSRRD